MIEQEIAYAIIRDQDHLRSGLGLQNSNSQISIQTLRDKQKLRRVINQSNAGELLGLSDEDVQALRSFYKNIC